MTMQIQCHYISLHWLLVDLLVDHLVDGVGLAAIALVEHLALCDLVDESTHIQILDQVHIVAIGNCPG